MKEWTKEEQLLDLMRQSWEVLGAFLDIYAPDRDPCNPALYSQAKIVLHRLQKYYSEWPKRDEL
jgi:hypothetical protein